MVRLCEFLPACVKCGFIGLGFGCILKPVLSQVPYVGVSCTLPPFRRVLYPPPIKLFVFRVLDSISIRCVLCPLPSRSKCNSGREGAGILYILYFSGKKDFISPSYRKTNGNFQVEVWFGSERFLLSLQRQ